MTKDLDMTLGELGPEYRRMVKGMQHAFDETDHRRRYGYLAAAMITIIGAIAVIIGDFGNKDIRMPSIGSEYTLAYSAEPQSIAAILATQNADGSWANDFITTQNAAALKAVKGADVAYRKALRYLRSKGMKPISETELKERSEVAGRWLNDSCATHSAS